MWILTSLEWRPPLDYAAGMPEEESCWMLFYSGMKTPASGRYSYLVWGEKERLTDADWGALADKAARANLWGYLGYGMKDVTERLPKDISDAERSFPSAMPPMWMSEFGSVLRFDHERRVIEAEQGSKPAPVPKPAEAAAEARVTGLSSPMTKAEYLAQVRKMLEAIAAGEIYQANLTRKFGGRMKGAAGFPLFCRLAEVSPAPYAAYLKLDDVEVLSSSPEQFLRVEGTKAEARPIKGTAARHADQPQDEAAKTALKWSRKDRAENLMIVDLMRNDFSRSCVPGSVRVEDLFEVSTYATVHHMASTVLGQLREGVGAVELVKGCFPPGSMTGAPKIRAMELCTEAEKLARGVYAGAIGHLGPEGCDLSVVIRTLLLKGGIFEFQVGGAIVADSEPEAEWRETLVKAKAIAKTLNIEGSLLENL